MYREVLMNVSENLGVSIIDILATEESALHMEARRDARNKKPQTKEHEVPGIPITHTNHTECNAVVQTVQSETSVTTALRVSCDSNTRVMIP